MKISKLELIALFSVLFISIAYIVINSERSSEYIMFQSVNRWSDECPFLYREYSPNGLGTVSEQLKRFTISKGYDGSIVISSNKENIYSKGMPFILTDARIKDRKSVLELSIYSPSGKKLLNIYGHDIEKKYSDEDFSWYNVDGRIVLIHQLCYSVHRLEGEKRLITK